MIINYTAPTSLMWVGAYLKEILIHKNKGLYEKGDKRF